MLSVNRVQAVFPVHTHFVTVRKLSPWMKNLSSGYSKKKNTGRCFTPTRDILPDTLVSVRRTGCVFARSCPVLLSWELLPRPRALPPDSESCKEFLLTAVHGCFAMQLPSNLFSRFCGSSLLFVLRIIALKVRAFPKKVANCGNDLGRIAPLKEKTGMLRTFLYASSRFSCQPTLPARCSNQFTLQNCLILEPHENL